MDRSANAAACACVYICITYVRLFVQATLIQCTYTKHETKSKPTPTLRYWNKAKHVRLHLSDSVLWQNFTFVLIRPLRKKNCSMSCKSLFFDKWEIMFTCLLRVIFFSARKLAPIKCIQAFQSLAHQHPPKRNAVHDFFCTRKSQ